MKFCNLPGNLAADSLQMQRCVTIESNKDCGHAGVEAATFQRARASRHRTTALRSRPKRAGKEPMADNTDNIIVDTATRILQDLCEPNTVNQAEQGEWPKALWDALEESRLTLTWVPDEFGGAGATLGDGFAVLRAAGRFAAPVPLAETLMAVCLLSQAGIAVPGGPLTIAPIHADGRIGLGGDGVLSGRARQVP